MADKGSDSGEEEDPTIAEDVVVTKYKMAGDMANRKCGVKFLVSYWLNIPNYDVTSYRRVRSTNFLLFCRTRKSNILCSFICYSIPFIRWCNLISLHSLYFKLVALEKKCYKGWVKFYR